MPAQPSWHPALAMLLPNPAVPCSPAHSSRDTRAALSKPRFSCRAGLSCVEFPSSAERSCPQAPPGC